ncbi:MAG: hypothetical protein HYR85_13925 [Planctomycetes bacterium]|nr:hypothetical protein [Planctomycetota bacterium]MBI3843583.1 hypothetical protein [Planctomycetota bacterium]
MTPRLSRLQFWSIFAIAVAIFALGCGPIWRHPFDIDVAVFVSYAPIPLLVLACLAWSKKLGAAAFFLDTIEIAALKFGVTYGAAIVLWAASSGPAAPIWKSHPDEVAADATPAMPLEPPTPTPIAPGSTGVLDGFVAAEDGAAVAGALVWVRDGLEQFVFAAPTEPVLLQNDGSGFTPRLAVVQAWQPLIARSTNSKLHTLQALAEDGSTLFNYPIFASGDSRQIVLHRAYGIVTLGCKVHALDRSEAKATLAVLAHPFFAITGVDGRCSIRGVPEGRLRVGAMHPDRGDAAADVTLTAGSTTELRLRLVGRSR